MELFGNKTQDLSSKNIFSFFTLLLFLKKMLLSIWLGMPYKLTNDSKDSKVCLRVHSIAYGLCVLRKRKEIEAEY